jgi:branched-chain amino acid transport system permease protein
MRWIRVAPAGADGGHRPVGEVRVPQVADGIGTIEGPVIGALVLFALQQWLSQEGAWHLVFVGGIAVVATLAVRRRLWEFVSSRWSWSLFPIGYRLPGRDHHREPG